VRLFFSSIANPEIVKNQPDYPKGSESTLFIPLIVAHFPEADPENILKC